MNPKFELMSSRYYTRQLDCRFNNDSETIGHRALSLDFVKEVDYLHGVITVKGVLSENDWAVLEEVLETPVAENERTWERFIEWGNTPYQTVYEAGDYVFPQTIATVK